MVRVEIRFPLETSSGSCPQICKKQNKNQNGTEPWELRKAWWVESWGHQDLQEHSTSRACVFYRLQPQHGKFRRLCKLQAPEMPMLRKGQADLQSWKQIGPHEDSLQFRSPMGKLQRLGKHNLQPDIPSRCVQDYVGGIGQAGIILGKKHIIQCCCHCHGNAWMPLELVAALGGFTSVVGVTGATFDSDERQQQGCAYWR